jgi:hypothetical protein
MPIGKGSRAQTIDSINVKKAERGHDWKPIHAMGAVAFFGDRAASGGAAGEGALRSELVKLAAREWRHPATGEPVRFGASTIERRYSALRERHDPVAVLRRKRRQDPGQQVVMGAPLRQALLAQYAAHKSRSVMYLFVPPRYRLLEPSTVSGSCTHELIPVIRRVSALKHLLKHRIGVGRTAICPQSVVVVDPSENDHLTCRGLLIAKE